VPLATVLVHTGRPVVPEQTGPKVDGKAQVNDEPGTPFDCVLFLPAPGGEEDRGRRVVKRPTLLFGPFDRAGEPVTLAGKQKVLVTAPELTGPDAVLWQVEGNVQAFGKPGRPIKGSQATLRRVED
jgi:hypothetical protein